jgi:hypothetical protein
VCDERDLRPDHPDQRLDGAGLIAISSISARIQETGGIAASIVAAVEQQGATTQEIVRNVAKAAQGIGGWIAHIAGVAGAVEETGAAVSQVLGAAPDCRGSPSSLPSSLQPSWSASWIPGGPPEKGEQRR